MFVNALQLFNPKKATGLFVIAVVLLTSLLYVVFDSYLDSVGREIASGWLQSEAVEIQEGNLLSSISKNQRVLLSSQFIKGIKLIDSANNVALIEFGENYSDHLPAKLDVGMLDSVAFGFLNRRVYYKMPQQPDLILSFQTHSDFLIRAFLATVACFIALIVFLFVSIRKIETMRIEAENKNRILLGEVAARVAHDIRSPLSTLNAVLETVEGLPPNSRKLLTTAISRIREIGLGIAEHSKLAMSESSNLRKELASSSSQTEPILIAPLVEELLDEKRIQYPDRAQDISVFVASNVHSKFANVNQSELRRSLSNLIDNSIEASTVGSPIATSVTASPMSITIEIADQGIGIEQSHLDRIGEKGFTRNKPNGTGIGVHFAKRTIAAWNGRLQFKSVRNIGTTVTIELPCTSAPIWFANDVLFAGYSTVVIVDDDPTIHSVWQNRISEAAPDVSVEHFFDAESASSWAIQNRAAIESCLLLTDFNLNSRSGTGVTVLERFGLHHPSAIMVTNAFNDPGLRQRCHTLNVKILPKTMIY